MSDDIRSISDVVRQQLYTDKLLGLTSVPVAPAVIEKCSSHAQKGEAPGQSHIISGKNQTTPREVDAKVLEEKRERLRGLDESQVKGCMKCGLHETRTNTVFGQGHSHARLVFVGEAPGFEEDRQGLAFVGKAGQLLTRMIAAMGLSRDDVFICNVLKCRPPNNREPAAVEVLACGPYLREQLDIIQPEVLVALGSPAAKTLLNTALSIGKLRGRFHDYYWSGVTGIGNSIPLMPTYHPAYLLRNPAEKGKTWEDLKQVMAFMGLPVP